MSKDSMRQNAKNRLFRYSNFPRFEMRRCRNPVKLKILKKCGLPSFSKKIINNLYSNNRTTTKQTKKRKKAQKKRKGKKKNKNGNFYDF